ncbi:MAG: hypothetical protein HKM05_12365 [Spirochaetales bacterium]|nr:hypothetical protein [Spirochaetales bacterium]
MTKYRKIVDEILQGTATDPVRRQLLGPRPQNPHTEIAAQLPRRKRFVGPAPWYDVLKQRP